MRDGMIGGTNNGDAICFKFVVGAHKVFVRITDFEPNMIQAGFWVLAILRSATDLDQEEFVMGPAATKHRRPTKALQLVESKRISIEIRRPFQIAHE